MDRVMVNITWKCNLGNCPYCWVNQVVRGTDLETVDDHSAVEWIRALNNLPPAIFDFVGGEPLIFPNFVDILVKLDGKHQYAITSNLHDFHAVLQFVNRAYAGQCSHFTGSFHPTGELSPEDFAHRLWLIQMKGIAVSINIIQHKSIKDKDMQYYFNYFKEKGFAVHISPYEHPPDIKYTTKKLMCVAGVDHYVINNNGDVYPCLTWFRFKERDKKKLGNIFDGSFKKLKDVNTCSLFCEMLEVVDQNNSMVRDLNIREI